MDDDPAGPLRAAREAHGRGDWARARELFADADGSATLSAGDLAALSDACWWLGRVDECVEAGERAFRTWLEAGDERAAARMALELAVPLLMRGDEALGSGWLARAQRLLAELPEGVEHGYVRYVTEVEAKLDAAPGAVAEAARGVSELGRRHDDANLTAVGVIGEGRALLRLGEVADGMRLLDEAMVIVHGGGLDPEWAGNVYCHLMAACHELGDIERARRWTEATWEWLSGLSAAVLFTGICRVHRSQVLQTSGEWDRAEQAAARVSEDLHGLDTATLAEAHYQRGELRRLRDDPEGAEAAYGRARGLGRDPQPGLALLRLAQGRGEVAAASIDAALHAAGSDRLGRARLCAAQVEIGLAVDDPATARRACTELEATAATYGTSGLEAAALQCRGALALAENRPEEALPALRAAQRRWRGVGAPYDVARCCVLLGRVYRALGDRDAAATELATAGRTFERLGAAADSRRVAALTGDRPLPGGLTAREAEVLAEVATGRTNAEVAGALVISEKTVARHLSNIFDKLEVSTRTEAAAFAFEHGLAGTRSG